MCRNIVYCLLTYIFLLSYVNSSAADELKKQISYYVKSEKYSFTPECAYQDSTGYMWFCGSDGLVKHDGYNFSFYTHDPLVETSISDNYVKAIIETSDSTLWIGTRLGLSKTSINNMKFEHYFPDDNNENSISHSEVISLFIDRKDRLWVGTSYGLNLYNNKTDSFVSYVLPYKYDEQSANAISDIYQTEDCCLWLATSEGLVKFNHFTEKFESILFDEFTNNRFSSNRVIDIEQVDNNFLWLATRNGLIKYNIKLNKPSRIYKKEVKDSSINFLKKDNANTLWIGTHSKWLVNYIPNDDRYVYYDLVSIDPDSVADDGVCGIFLDDNKVLWIMSYIDKGIKKIFLDSYYKRLTYIDDNMKSYVVGNTGQYFLDNKKNLWISGSSGIKHIKKWYKDDSITLDYKVKGSVQHDYSLSLEKFHQGLSGSIWAIGFKNIYVLNNDEFIPASILYPNVGSLYFSDALSVPLEYTIGNYLMGTWRLGLIKFSGNNKQIFNMRNSDISQNSIEQLFRDNGGDVWFTTFGGINKYSVTDNNISHIKGKDGSISDVFATNLLETKELMWIAAESGVYSFNKESATVKHYRDKYSELVAPATQIAKGDEMLWFGSRKGLIGYDSIKEEFTRYYLHEAFSNEIFFNGKLIHLDDNQLAFVNNNFDKSIMLINANKLDANTSSANLIITALSINNKLMALTPNSKSLQLEYDDYALSIEFSLLDYIDPKRSKYSYKLEGLDTEWVNVSPKIRKANYTTLPAGDYIFRARAENLHGVKAKNELAIKIKVLPPWWKTNLAYIIYIVLLIAFGYLINYVRTSFLKGQTKKLEILVDQKTESLNNKTKALEESNNKIKILLKSRSRLFANTSHELRTPLTLILAPINNLLENCHNHQRNELLLAKRNTEHLIHMVGQLLDLARLSSDVERLVNPTDFTRVTKLILDSIQSSIKEKEIKLHIDLDENIIVDALQNSLDTLLLNLMSNAVKYTDKGGKISVSLKKQETFAVLSVKDTGIGIAKKDQERIFEQFTRLDAARNLDVPGSGLGLSLVKDLLEAHGGNIQVVSEENEGVAFIIQLRLSDSNLEDVIIPASNSDLSHYEVNYFKRSMQNDHVNNEFNIYKKNSNITAEQSEKPTILVVEDNKEMLRYIVSILTDYYHCVACTSGMDALTYAENHFPDLILCDVMMPDVDGFEVLTKVRNNIEISHIPIILLTAKGDQFSRIHAYDNHVDDYINKPFDNKELLSRIARLLKRQEDLKKYFAQDSYIMGVDISRLNLVNRDKELFLKFEDYIRENYSYDSITVGKLAEVLSISERSLQEKVKLWSGKAPITKLNNYRLKMACIHLKESDESVTLISEKVGFKDSSNFHRLFKKQYNITPSAYRKSEISV